MSQESTEQLREVRDLIARVFSPADLEMLVHDHLGERLASLVGSGPHLHRVFELLQACEARGWLDRLLDAVAAERQQNPEVALLMQRLGRPTTSSMAGGVAVVATGARSVGAVGTAPPDVAANALSKPRDEELQGVAKQLDDAYAQKERNHEIGEPTTALTHEIRDLKRKLPRAREADAVRERARRWIALVVVGALAVAILLGMIGLVIKDMSSFRANSTKETAASEAASRGRDPLHDGDSREPIVTSGSHSRVAATPVEAFLDEMFPDRGWFCFPDHNSSMIGIRRVPDGFIVRSPLAQIDIGEEHPKIGEHAAFRGGTGRLTQSIVHCPDWQRLELERWQSAEANHPITVNDQYLDKLFGKNGLFGNEWRCRSQTSYAIDVTLIKSFKLEYPFTTADNGPLKVPIGEVLSEGRVTLWFSGYCLQPQTTAP